MGGRKAPRLRVTGKPMTLMMILTIITLYNALGALSTPNEEISVATDLRGAGRLVDVDAEGSFN